MLRQGVLHYIERDRLDVSGVAPRRVYIGDHPTEAGHYVLVDTRSEATAYLKDNGSSVLTFDDDPAEDDKGLFLVDPTDNTVLING